MRFWTLAANPGAFRVEDNVREQDVDLWRTDRSKVTRGDRIAIYKYKGRDGNRGIVSLGQVLTDPEMMYIPPGTDPYDVIGGYGRALAVRTPCVRVRYVRSPRMPLWADLGSGSVVDELPVARAQGGTVHHVTPEQWERLLGEAGVAGWPPAESPAADVIEDEVTKLVREHGKGQGPGLSAAARSLVERRAMEVATRHFETDGWTVEDVSAVSSYDLLCWHGSRTPRRVEVKGTTGGASAVILTRKEVMAARADPEAAVLAIVHGIKLDQDRAKATGGLLRIISPWKLDDSALSPIAYRYQVPLR